jgi:copper chaperone CopZ
VQDALEGVDGVKEVKILMVEGEAVVKYDSEKCTVEDLVDAVNHARGMSKYTAKAKKE